MKLQLILEQLQGVKKYRDYKWRDIIYELMKHGISMHREGAFGQVFTHPSWDYVVKVFSHDDVYMDFVNFAISNPNKHYPKFIKKPMKIHQFHTRNANNTDKFMYVVKIEELRPIPEEMEPFFNSDALTDIVKAHINKFDHHLFYVKDHKGNYKWTDMSVEDFIKNYSQEFQLDTLLPAYKNILDHIGHRFSDLHSGNVMMRSDGTLVIIDPVADSYLINSDISTFKDSIEDEYNIIKGPIYKQIIDTMNLGYPQ